MRRETDRQTDRQTDKQTDGLTGSCTAAWTRNRSFCSGILCDRFGFPRAHRYTAADAVQAPHREYLKRKPPASGYYGNHVDASLTLALSFNYIAQ